MKIFLRSKKVWVISLLVSFLLAVSVAPLFAEEEKPTGDATVAVLSKYIWRGYELSRNSIVVQPSMTIGYKGFSANVWGNLDTHPYYSGTDPDKSYSSTLNETDVTLSYSKTLGLFTLGGGYIYYGLGSLNPDAAKRLDAQEIFASVGLNTILSPTFTVYREVDHYRNWYFLLGVSHAFEFNKRISLKLAATASYLLSTDETTYPKFDDNAAATSDKFSNFHDGNLTVSLPIKATSNITLTPTVSYVFPLSDDAKNEMKGFGLSGKTPADRDSSFIYGGLTLALSF
jgi:hypothetical protein